MSAAYRIGAEMLNDKDLITLNDKLYVPGAMRDLMTQGNTIDPDTRYRLHEIISNFQPDSALISIAMAAREIISLQLYPTMSLNTLKLRCERIIKDYGPVWLEHAAHKDINQNVLFDTLAQIPDDLADIAELLEINADTLRGVDDKAAMLFDILKIQAGAHAIIAEEFVDVMESAEAETFHALPPQVFTNNVIPFRQAGRV